MMIVAWKRRPMVGPAACLLFALATSLHAEDYRFVSQWGSEGTGNGQFDDPRSVAVDASGNVYVADTDNHRIQKFTSTGAFLTKWGAEGTGDGQFDSPGGVAVSPMGNVYVADTNNHRIQKFTSAGTFVIKWGSNGSGDGQFAYPRAVAVDIFANVYVAGAQNQRVQKFASTGAFITKWGSLGSGDGQFSSPSGVAADASGNVYVSDMFNHRMQKFTSAGAFLTKWGSNGTGDGQFKYPYGVAVGPSGSVYVADYWLHRIQKFTSTGTFVTKWGFLGSGNGQFDYPHDVAVDGSGNVYVADTDNHQVQKFALARPRLEWTGAPGYVADGIKPNSGPSGTTFAFKVKYTDEAAADPLKATCRTSKRLGNTWKFCRKLNLAKQSGDVATGAIYGGSTVLGNFTWKHKFHFKAADTTDVTGDPPCDWTPLPEITGPARLFWCGKPGYTVDGVHPNKGPTGTRFTFKVMYQDSDDKAPDTHELVIRRNGAPYKTKNMTMGGGVDYRLGRTYAASWTATQSGAYTYRFRFVSAGLAAKNGQKKGDPTNNTSGPTITESAGLIVSGLSSVPTRTGAQVTFTLSSPVSITATILNLAGRPIRTVALDKPLDAGLQTLLWDRKDATGLVVPPGLYLIRLTARTDAGLMSNAVTPLSVP